MLAALSADVSWCARRHKKRPGVSKAQISCHNVRLTSMQQSNIICESSNILKYTYLIIFVMRTNDKHLLPQLEIPKFISFSLSALCWRSMQSQWKGNEDHTLCTSQLIKCGFMSTLPQLSSWCQTHPGGLEMAQKDPARKMQAEVMKPKEKWKPTSAALRDALEQAWSGWLVEAPHVAIVN